MRKKSIQYAYASSPISDKLNNGRGCWLVNDESGLPPFTFQDNEKKQALKLFQSIQLEIDTVISFTESDSVFK